MTPWRTVGDSPVVTYGLIAVCCLTFLVSPLSGFTTAYGEGDALRAAQRAYFERWGVIPGELTHHISPRTLLTPLTAIFVHGSWLHLLGNMLFLHVFGVMTEERMGRAQFLVFYLVVGYLAMFGYAAANAGSERTLVGASGAISGVLGAFLYLFPAARVTSLFPFLLFLPLRLPAWIVLIFWFVLQWVAADGAGSGPGIAYLAHLVGFSAGLLYSGGRYWRTDRVSDEDEAGDKAGDKAAATEGERQP